MMYVEVKHIYQRFSCIKELLPISKEVLVSAKGKLPAKIIRTGETVLLVEISNKKCLCVVRNNKKMHSYLIRYTQCHA